MYFPRAIKHLQHLDSHCLQPFRILKLYRAFQCWAWWKKGCQNHSMLQKMMVHFQHGSLQSESNTKSVTTRKNFFARSLRGENLDNNKSHTLRITYAELSASNTLAWYHSQMPKRLQMLKQYYQLDAQLVSLCTNIILKLSQIYKIIKCNMKQKSIVCHKFGW